MEKFIGVDDIFIVMVDVFVIVVVMDFVFSDGGVIYDNVDRVDFYVSVRNVL